MAPVETSKQRELRYVALTRRLRPLLISFLILYQLIDTITQQRKFLFFNYVFAKQNINNPQSPFLN